MLEYTMVWKGTSARSKKYNKKFLYFGGIQKWQMLRLQLTALAVSDVLNSDRCSAQRVTRS